MWPAYSDKINSLLLYATCVVSKSDILPTFARCLHSLYPVALTNQHIIFFRKAAVLKMNALNYFAWDLELISLVQICSFNCGCSGYEKVPPDSNLSILYQCSLICSPSGRVVPQWHSQSPVVQHVGVIRWPLGWYRIESEHFPWAHRESNVGWRWWVDPTALSSLLVTWKIRWLVSCRSHKWLHGYDPKGRKWSVSVEYWFDYQFWSHTRRLIRDYLLLCWYFFKWGAARKLQCTGVHWRKLVATHWMNIINSTLSILTHPYCP